MSDIMGPDKMERTGSQPISIASKEVLGHPSPELLASSVGNEVDGRLVPSSSTISLLSLSMQQQQQQQQQQTQQQDDATIQIPINFTRMSSFNQQQRHQHYQSGNSGFTSRRVSMNNSSMSSPQMVQLPGFAKQTSPRAIPPREEDFTPDSPNLNPVSLGGSPSKFWLTNPTPPNGLPFLQMQRISSNQHINTLRQHRGSMNKTTSSPVLMPVGSVTESGAMTPLQLSKEGDFPYRNGSPES